ncbi:MAG TPA: AI-2E family transporter [Candidatus Acidoferrum sp.]|nr:AI-2E family transporter [Candidatus Acidoferrum sp.]
MAEARPDESDDLRKDAARWFARGVGFAAGALLIYAVLRGLQSATSAVLLVFAALLLATALDPVISSLRSRLPIPRGAAILTTYVAFALIVLGVGFIIVPGAVAQAGDLTAALPTTLERARDWASHLEPAALANSAMALIGEAQKALRPAPAPSSTAVVAAGLSIADVVFSVATILTLVYFWLTERSRLQRFAMSFLPPDRRAGFREAWNDIEIRLGGWVRGQLTLMAVVGLATGLAYGAIGVPSAPILGFIAALTEAIPLIGPVLGAIPAVLLTATFRPDALVPMLIAYAVIHLVESNVLVPRIMRNAIGVSPFLIVVSLLVGGAAGGLPGALLAVPTVAAIVTVLERAQDRTTPIAQDAAAASEPATPDDAAVPVPAPS